jgi:hypothetical protein
MKTLITIAITAVCSLAPLTGQAHVGDSSGQAANAPTELQKPRFLFKCSFCGRVVREPYKARCPDRPRGMPHAWVKFRP